MYNLFICICGERVCVCVIVHCLPLTCTYKCVVLFFIIFSRFDSFCFRTDKEKLGYPNGESNDRKDETPPEMLLLLVTFYYNYIIIYIVEHANKKSFSNQLTILLLL